MANTTPASDGDASVRQAQSDQDATADEIAQAPETVNLSDAEEVGAANNKDNSEGGKIKALLGILRRMMGVKDLAAIRLSLPANLLEPVPNLEYWNYLDRADLFAAIGECDDQLDRMLATLRFSFSKELKFVHGKVPEILENGDHLPKMDLLTTDPTPLATAQGPSSSTAKNGRVTTSDNSSSQEDSNRSTNSKGFTALSNTSSTSSSNDADAGKARKGLSRILQATRANKTATSNQSVAESQPSETAVKGDGEPNNGGDGSAACSFKTSRSNAEELFRRVAFLTEQVSHHPPISSFFVECKDSGVQLYGVDQLSGKFTGTSIRIFPGEMNKGIFVRLTENAKEEAIGEEYQITHPTASINGLLRGSLWVSIGSTTSITCRGGRRKDDSPSRLRTLVEYKDESWMGKAKYALEGVIYEYDSSKEGADVEFSQPKDVPADRIVATLEGSWKGQIYWKHKGDKEQRVLVDLEQLHPIKSKDVRPIASQDTMESRRIWQPVTDAILGKEFGAATKHKQNIEQEQRDRAAERKRAGHEFEPQFFDKDISDGRPRLTTTGRKALDDELSRSKSSDL